MINLCGFISELERAAKKHINESAASVEEAVKILYMIDKLPKSSSARSKYVKLLQSLQGEKSGLCRNGVSETASVLSALSLLDSKFEFQPASILKHKGSEQLESLSNSLPWHDAPTDAAKELCSVFAILYHSDLLTYDEIDSFIQMLYNDTDGDTGLIRNTYIDYRNTEPLRYLKAFFRYLMILEHTHSPIRYPARTIDTCIQFYDRKYIPKLSCNTSYSSLVWVYCTARTMKYTGYRYDDCKKRLLEFEKEFEEFLPKIKITSSYMSLLFIIACIAAELQSALPGTIKTERPLKNVLDQTTYF